MLETLEIRSESLDHCTVYIVTEHRTCKKKNHMQPSKYDLG